MSEWQPPEISLFFWPHEMCVSGFQAVDEDILTGTEAVGDGHEIGPVSRFFDSHPAL